MPEQLHGAGLAAVPAGELLQRVRAPLEHAQESRGRFGVVAGVLVICRKRCRGGDAIRLGPDLSAHVDGLECFGEGLVEVGDGQPVVELEAGLGGCGAGREPMVNEVDLELEVVSFHWHAPRRQTVG